MPKKNLFIRGIIDSEWSKNKNRKQNLYLFGCLVILALPGSLALFSQPEYDSSHWVTDRTVMPENRGSRSSCVIDSKVYFFSVSIRNTEWENRNASEMLIYDTENNTWESREIPDQFKRGSISVHAINDKIYLLGGTLDVYDKDSMYYYFSVDVYDPHSESWQSRANFPGKGLGLGCTIGEKIYVVEDDWEHPVNGAYCYDTYKDTWSRIADFNYARQWATVESFKGKVYLLGGVGSKEIEETDWYWYFGTETVEVYDPLTNTWSYGPSLPEGRVRLSSSFISGNRFIIFGGHCKLGVFPHARREVYELKEEEWELLAYLPDSSGSHTVEQVGDKAYIFGGWKDFYSDEGDDKVWIYDLSPGNTKKETGLKASCFPNPVNDLLTVSLETAGNYHVRIYSMHGELLVNDHFSGVSYETDFSAIPTGVYFLHLISNDANMTLMVIRDKQ